MMRDLHIYYAIRSISKAQGGFFNMDIIKQVAKITNLKQSTVIFRVNRLRKLNWVIDCKYDGYRFKSQAKIFSELELSGYRIISFAEIKDFESFRALCYAGVVSKIHKGKIYSYKQKLLRDGIRTKRGDKNPEIEIALNYLSKYLGITYSMSQRVRKVATTLGYLKITEDYNKKFHLTDFNIEDYKKARLLSYSRFKAIKKVKGIYRVIDNYFVSPLISTYSSKTLKTNIYSNLNTNLYDNIYVKKYNSGVNANLFP
jgi:hypothetical protein